MISGKGNMYKTSDKSKKISDNLHKLSESELFNNAVSKLSELNEEELEVVSNLIDLLSKKNKKRLYYKFSLFLFFSK